MLRVGSADMDRIAVIGCGGSGKSTLARHLATRLHLPLTHLDAIYYDTDWNTLPTEAFAAIQHDLTARPRWVIDGNYATTLPIRLASADTVVVMDVPTAVALWGVLQRRLRYRGGQHTDGVYDRITWVYLRYITSFRRRMRPRIHRLLAEHAGHATIVTLPSRRAARRWLASLQR